MGEAAEVATTEKQGVEVEPMAKGVAREGYFWVGGWRYVYVYAWAQQRAGNKGRDRGLGLLASCVEKLNPWLYATLIYSLGACVGFESRASWEAM